MDINILLEFYKIVGVNLGLECIYGLLVKLGNFQVKVFYVYVGGINGKGLVCVYLFSVLVEVGYKVGCYIFFYLIDWWERVWFDNCFIDDVSLIGVL